MQEGHLLADPNIKYKYRNSNIVRTIKSWLFQLHLNDDPLQSTTTTNQKSSLCQL